MSQFFSKQLNINQPLATKIFQKSINENKLAKAYLLLGQAEGDKLLLVKELTAHLNCIQKSSQLKGSCLIEENRLPIDTWCINCRWIHEDKHPQAIIRLSGASNKSSKIAVEDARAFANEVGKTSSYCRVMVIEDASQEILHRPAANTLLKTIEEPRSKVLMIFFARVLSDVLPTITSRCQMINLSSNQYNQCFSLTSKSQFEKLISVNPNSSLLEKCLPSLEKLTSQDSTFADAINATENIQALLKNDIDIQDMLDYLVAMDLFSTKNIFAKNNTQYAKELFLISQIAKEQSKHYVSQRAAIETFIYAWHRLKLTGINPLKIQR